MTYICVRCQKPVLKNQRITIYKDWKFNQEKGITEWVKSNHKTLICLNCK